MSDEREDLAPLVVGDTYLSEVWAVVVDGQAVNLEESDGWTLTIAARHPRTDAVIVSWPGEGATIELGTAQVRVGSGLVTTSTLSLHLTPARTAALAAEQILNLEVRLDHPTHGPRGKPYRATLVEEPLLVVAARP